MTQVIKYSDDMLGWKRKPGPLRIWRVVDGRKKTADGKTMRFSIQEIPENRQDDVMNLMCAIFTRDEPVCHHLNAIDNPVAIEDFRKLWSLVLQKGLVVGAFLVDEHNEKSVLAGANMTLVNCETTEKTLQTRIETRLVYFVRTVLVHKLPGTSLSNNNSPGQQTLLMLFSIRSEETKKLLQFMHELDTEINVRELYNVDKWITAFGLCINPQYRGQGLGYHLLNARNDIAAAYDIRATSTVFTAPAAQKAAAQNGFEVLLERNFVDVKNEDGTEMFSGIPQKSVKLMGKTFSRL